MSARIVRPADRDLQPVREGNPILLQVIADGLAGNPYVHVTEIPAGHHIAAHSHSEDEVTVILSGTALVAGAGLAYVAVVAVSGGATIAVAKVVGKVGVQVVVRLGPAAIAAIGATNAAGAKDA